MSERDRMELADILDRADDKIQHGVGFGGYDPNGLPFWLADAILASDWLAARDARIREEALGPVRALADQWQQDADSKYRGMAAKVSRDHAYELRSIAVLDTPAQATRYCAACGAAESNHWPGGSRFDICTFTPAQADGGEVG